MAKVSWPGLPWGWHFNPHTHPIPTGIPIRIPMGIPIPTGPEVSTLLHVGYTIPHRQILAVCWVGILSVYF